MPHVRLQVHIRALCEIRQHDNVQVVRIGEPVLAAHVEQGGNARHPVNVNAHSVGRKADEIGVIDGLCRRQRVRVGGAAGASREELVVVQLQQVDTAGSACSAVTTGKGGLVGVQGLCNHAIDGAHHKAVNLDGHGAVNGVVNHADKAVKLCRVAETLLDLLFGEAHGNLERHLAVEELCGNSRLVENVLLVFLPVHQVPTLVFGGFGGVTGNLFQHRTELPTIHQDRRDFAGIGAVDENDLADMVHKGFHVVVNRACVEHFGANVHNVGQVLCNKVGLAEHFTGYGIHQFINLFDSHFAPFLSYS